MEKHTESIQYFWQWFENQYEIFINENCIQKKPAHELQNELEKIHPDLCFQIAHRADSHCYELVFSCGANLQLKALVKEIAALAPSFPQVHITAFKQRTDLCEGISLDHTTIHVESIRFMLKPLLNKVSIQIYTNEDFSRDDIQVAIILLLENLIGEELMLDYVGDIQFNYLSDIDFIHYSSLKNISSEIDIFISNLQKAWLEN